MLRRFLKLLLTVIALGLLTDHTVTAEESSWRRVFDDYYLSSIETAPFGLLIGQYDSRVWENPYNGIYISKDLGETWEELGLKDKGITHIKYSTNIYATTKYHTDTPPGLYVSKDMGLSWQHISPPYSSNYIEKIGNTLFLGTEAWGLLVSLDEGVTWEIKIPDIRIEDIQQRGNTIIASATNKTYQSLDGGITWNKTTYTKLYKQDRYHDYNYEVKTDDIYENNQKTNLNLLSQSIAITHTKPPYVYAIVNGEGVYKHEIPQQLVAEYPLLDIPWNYKTDNELIDKITSYFDHEYPLLGNYYAQEPNEVKNTTVNFLGMKEKPPLLYYSSHNGTDYALEYGENITAAAGGIATYSWCEACGNTVTIDHQNGYKTIYMHLEDNPLTKSLNNTYIERGGFIGKVGLTGNTTGPHLHFSVKKDNILIDPYGWQNYEYADPWEEYKWVDNLGEHAGTKSPYLWFSQIRDETHLVNELNPTITLETKTINFERLKSYIDYTVTLRNHIKPHINTPLKYIENTSILINAVDLLGNKIKQLPDIVEISFNITRMDLSKILLTSLKIYHFNELLNNWEPLETTIDIENNIVKANTLGFSHFALFGEPNELDRYFKHKVSIVGAPMVIGKW